MSGQEPRRASNSPHKADAREIRPVQARQGFMLGHMRYVLGISIALAVVAFAVIYFLYF
jgi:hypothetical protein